MPTDTVTWTKGGFGGGLVGHSGQYGIASNAAGGGGGQTSGGIGALYGIPPWSPGDFGGNCASGPGTFGAGGSCSRRNRRGGGGGGWWGGGAGFDGGGGGSSYTIPAGTIVQNVQGDARCSGNGWLRVSSPARELLPRLLLPQWLHSDEGQPGGLSVSAGCLHAELRPDANGGRDGLAQYLPPHGQRGGYGWRGE